MLRTGIDLVEIERFRRVLERHGERFLGRVFTPQERRDTGESILSLAARFAAKEAAVKALGCGIGLVAWQDVEVCKGESGEPLLCLHGKAAALAEELGLQTWSVSLSHTAATAAAVVVAASQA